MSVRNAAMSVVSTNMTIVRNAQKPATSVQSNAERWQHRLYQHKNPLRRVFYWQAEFKNLVTAR